MAKVYSKKKIVLFINYFLENKQFIISYDKHKIQKDWISSPSFFFLPEMLF
jgi:hypothetical protein